MVTVIMLGDVVGEPGLLAMETLLSPLLRETGAALTVVNGENAAAGFGLTGDTFGRLINAGADVVTSGNHVWEKREFWPVLDSGAPVLRPANYPETVPGRGWIIIEKAGLQFAVINLQGRFSMPQTNCPFKTLQALLSLPEICHAGKSGGIFVDFRAEFTEEKEALGFFADGMEGGGVSLIACTHTHIQTADERFLPGGAGYISDLGMTGISDSVIGMDIKTCLERSRTQVSLRMEPASEGTPELQGVRLDMENGRGVQISRIKVKP